MLVFLPLSGVDRTTKFRAGRGRGSGRHQEMGGAAGVRAAAGEPGRRSGPRLRPRGSVKLTLPMVGTC